MHLINFKALSAQQLNAFIDLGIKVKRSREQYVNALANKSVALIFQKTSPMGCHLGLGFLLRS